MTNETIYPISDTERIVVSVDPYPSMHPFHYGLYDGIGIQALRWDYSLDPGLYERRTDLDKFIDRLYADDQYDDIVDALNINGHDAFKITFRGYVQSQWMELLVYSEEPRGTSDARTPEEMHEAIEMLRQFFVGDVYTVAQQERVIWTSDKGEVRTEWQDTPWTVHECYFTNSEPNEAEARAFAGFPALSDVTA